MAVVAQGDARNAVLPGEVDGAARHLFGDERADAEVRVPDLQRAEAGNALRLRDGPVAQAAVHVGEVARIAVHAVAVHAIERIPGKDFRKVARRLLRQIGQKARGHGADRLVIGYVKHRLSSLSYAPEGGFFHNNI